MNASCWRRQFVCMRKDWGERSMSSIFSQLKGFNRDTLKSVETRITTADGKKVETHWHMLVKLWLVFLSTVCWGSTGRGRGKISGGAREQRSGVLSRPPARSLSGRGTGEAAGWLSRRGPSSGHPSPPGSHSRPQCGLGCPQCLPWCEMYTSNTSLASECE